MSIHAVIFDLGGVLVRTDDRLPRTRLAESLGMSYAELSALVFEGPSARQATLGQISEQEHLEATCLALKKPASEWQTFREAFFAGDGIDNELVDFIRRLRPKYKTGILSNAWSGVRQWLTEFWRIMDAFDEAVLSAEVGLMKPDPRIYALALQQLGVLPAEAVFVDDFNENVEAARRLGLHAIRFLNRAQALAELKLVLDSQE